MAKISQQLVVLNIFVLYFAILHTGYALRFFIFFATLLMLQFLWVAAGY